MRLHRCGRAGAARGAVGSSCARQGQAVSDPLAGGGLNQRGLMNMTLVLSEYRDAAHGWQDKNAAETKVTASIDSRYTRSILAPRVTL